MKKSETDQTEWIEIIDPKSRQRMFANLVTGHCAWEPPPRVAVKRMEENQWWELYDSATRRSYYYNPMSTETVWIRPIHGDIIPLARLQLLKQNTELGQASVAVPESSYHLPSNSSSSTPRNRRKAESMQSYRNPDYSRTANASSEFYANFNDLAAQLPDYPSSSGMHDTSFPSDPKKTRAPSTCSSRSQVSTKSRFNNCLQEMVSSQFTPELTPVMGRASNGVSMPRDFRGYSPTSSVSSCGQSTDMLSQNTNNSFVTSNSLTKTNHRQSAPPVTIDKGECWTKDGLKHALLDPQDKKLRKSASTLFKLVLSYMGDKKSKTVPEQTVLSILELRQNKPMLNDEVFLQLIKQLSENPKPDSVRRGWELLGILLFFFAPESPAVKEKLSKFVDNNSDSLLDGPEVSISQYAKHCLKRLQTPINNLKPSIGAITQARFNIFNPSKFGATLEELMEMQSHLYPDLKIPWIESTLIKLIIENGGPKTEGLFRIAADPEQLHTAMVQLDQNIKPRLKDCHVAAVLLKQWLRQLPNPLIPDSMYAKCLLVCSQPDNACCLIDQLPGINRIVLAKLLQLLQQLCDEETVKITKMDVSNLAMVMAPNILRCDSQDPAVIFASQRKEMEFTKTLIIHYDTAFVHSLE